MIRSTHRLFTRASAAVSAALAVTACAGGAEPAGYYAGAQGKRGAALRAALHEIIATQSPVAYSRTDEAMATTDRDPQHPSSVVLIYSRRREPASCCAGEWNREHLWPNALGIDRQLPAYSDLHHLRPSDYDVNAARGHKFYDESDPGDAEFLVEAHPEAPECSSDSDSWEPPEGLKGDIARAMFYMDVRYEGGGGEPDLELTDSLAAITTSAAKMGRLTTLLVWHLLDPVDDAERERNDRVYEAQGNRNPFVDRPEWVAEIWPSPIWLEMEGERATRRVTLVWPAGVPRLCLQASEDLAEWQEVRAAPQREGNQWRLTLATSGSPLRFFRLQLK